MMGEIMKDSLMENKTKDKGKEREVRREDDGDDGEDIDGLDMSLEAVDIGQGEGARKTGTSQPESSPRPKINLKYSDKTEEEALALIKNIEERHRDPMRNFRHPTREEDSDVFPGDVVITSFPAFTPAELRKKRMQLREQGKLPEISPSLPCLAAFNFTFSGQKSAPGAGEWKANKVFLLEGLSFLDPLFRLIATRIQ
jgi:hypothetical protein